MLKADHYTTANEVASNYFKKAKLLSSLKNAKNNNIILLISIHYFAYSKDWT